MLTWKSLSLIGAGALALGACNRGGAEDVLDLAMPPEMDAAASDLAMDLLPPPPPDLAPASLFADASLSAACSGPYGNALADFNGDGKLDAVTANYNDDTATVLLGLGSGTFGAPTSYATGAGPWAVSAADLNGDRIQ